MRWQLRSIIKARASSQSCMTLLRTEAPTGRHGRKEVATNDFAPIGNVSVLQHTVSEADHVREVGAACRQAADACLARLPEKHHPACETAKIIRGQDCGRRQPRQSFHRIVMDFREVGMTLPILEDGHSPRWSNAGSAVRVPCDRFPHACQNHGPTRNRIVARNDPGTSLRRSCPVGLTRIGRRRRNLLFQRLLATEGSEPKRRGVRQFSWRALQL